MRDLAGTALALGCLVAAGYLVGSRLSWRAGAAAVVAMLALAELVFAIHEDTVVPVVVALVAAWLVGRETATRRRLVAVLATRNRELEEEEEAHSRLAVRRERARIARELHDIVTHHLAVIAVQAGAGRMATPAQADAVAERLASIRSSSARALTEMARLTRVVAGVDGDPRTRLREIVDGARTAGLLVRCDPPPAIPGPSADIVCRVVQEALTNAVKHAGGAEVTVALTRSASQLHIEVRDDGGQPVAGLADTGGGAGLTGMRSRVVEAGGCLRAGPDESGWRVVARLPLPTSEGVVEDTPAG